jgi:hypothetical protein
MAWEEACWAARALAVAIEVNQGKSMFHEGELNIAAIGRYHGI